MVGSNSFIQHGLSYSSKNKEMDGLTIFYCVGALISLLLTIGVFFYAWVARPIKKKDNSAERRGPLINDRKDTKPGILFLGGETKLSKESIFQKSEKVVKQNSSKSSVSNKNTSTKNVKRGSKTDTKSSEEQSQKNMQNSQESLKNNSEETSEISRTSKKEASDKSFTSSIKKEVEKMASIKLEQFK